MNMELEPRPLSSPTAEPLDRWITIEEAARII